MKIVLTILTLILLGCVILYFAGKKSVRSEIVIDADIKKIWSIITDLENYNNWNSVMTLKQGTAKQGSKVVYEFIQDAENTYDVSVTIKNIQPEQLLNQKGGIPLILTYNHTFTLEPQGEKTKVIINEDYRGIGVNFWNPEKVGQAYERINHDLKKESEK